MSGDDDGSTADDDVAAASVEPSGDRTARHRRISTALSAVTGALPAAEHRPGQEQMAHAVSDAIVGQRHVVDVHLVSAESEGAVKANLERKQAQADDMANSMVAHMCEMTQQAI
ncbi:MAG: hypothetical protein ACO3C1_12300, partial [Ilumatobacteraceae bacterium]